MAFVMLVIKSAFRNRLRALLTASGVAIAIIAFLFLRTFIAAWYAGADAAAVDRMVVRNKISIIFPLPTSYVNKVKQVPGVSDISWANWFGGLYIDGANSVVGGSTPGDRNVISGNGAGVVISGVPASGNQVRGNYIGTDATGSVALGNTGPGVAMQGGTSGNQIGGTSAGARNVISGNTGFGVGMENDGTSGNTVQGNCIGTAADGVTAMGNGSHGVFIIGDAGTSGNVIGGIAPGAGNIIANNGGVGVTVGNAGAVNNPIRGNSIHDNAGLGINLGIRF